MRDTAQVVDGHVRQAAVVAVDAAHDLVHHAAQLLRSSGMISVW